MKSFSEKGELVICRYAKTDLSKWRYIWVGALYEIKM